MGDVGRRPGPDVGPRWTAGQHGEEPILGHPARRAQAGRVIVDVGVGHEQVNGSGGQVGGQGQGLEHPAELNDVVRQAEDRIR